MRVLLAQALAGELYADELYQQMVNGIVDGDNGQARAAATEMTRLGSEGVYALLELLRGPTLTWNPMGEED